MMNEFKKRSYQITKDIIDYVGKARTVSFNGPTTNYHMSLKKSIMRIVTDSPTGEHEMIVSAFSIISKYNTIMVDIDDGRLFFYVTDNSPEPNLILNCLDNLNVRLWGVPVDDFSFVQDNKDLVDILTKIRNFINYLNGIEEK